MLEVVWLHLMNEVMGKARKHVPVQEHLIDPIMRSDAFKSHILVRFCANWVELHQQLGRWPSYFSAGLQGSM